MKEKLWGYINTEGEWAIVPSFNDAGNFHEGLAAIKIDWARGYINHAGELVISPRFEYTGDFQGGKAVVKEDGVWKVIDAKGNVLPEVATPPTIYGSVAEDIKKEAPKEIPYAENGKMGYKDREGNIIVPPRFYDAAPFCDGLARVMVTKAGKWTFIDKSGNIAFSKRFLQAEDFHEGLAAVLVSIDV